MSAAPIIVERKVATEERLARIESNVEHIQSDTLEMKDDIKSLERVVQEVSSDQKSFKTEVAKEFGRLRAELGEFKVSAVKEIEALKASVDSVRAYCELTKVSLESLIETSIERAKLWMLVTGVGAVVMPTLTFVAHLMKWF